MKKIELTKEEVEKFYSQIAKEDACSKLVSDKIISSIQTNSLEEYIVIAQDLLAKVLEESNLFLLSLRKKYGLRNIYIENDYILADDEDIIDPKNLIKNASCSNCSTCNS